MTRVYPYTKPLPSQTRLRELFDYDAKTGNLLYKQKSNMNRNVSGIVGWDNKSGYLATNVDGRIYLVHRLVYAWHGKTIVTGMMIDHINNNRADNRIENLQLATPQENSRKKRVRSDNQTGYKGVTYNRSTGKFQALAKIKGKLTHLGLFPDPKDAARAYDKAVLEHFGKFCITNFPIEDYADAI